MGRRWSWCAGARYSGWWCRGSLNARRTRLRMWRRRRWSGDWAWLRGAKSEADADEECSERKANEHREEEDARARSLRPCGSRWHDDDARSHGARVVAVVERARSK